MMFYRPLIFQDRRTGEVTTAQNGADAARLLKSNPNLTEYPGSGSLQTLHDYYGVNANGERVDGSSLVGNITGNPGYVPGQSPNSGGGLLHNLLFGYSD